MWPEIKRHCIYAFFLWSVLWIFSFLDCFDRRVLLGIVKVMPGHHEKAGKFSLLRSQVFLFKLHLLRNQNIEFHDVWSLPSWALASGDCAALGGRKQTNIKPSPDLDKHWYFSLGDKTVESFKTAQTSPQDPNWKSPGMVYCPKNESERKVFVSLTGGLANGLWELRKFGLATLRNGRILGLSGPRWRFCRFDGDIKAVRWHFLLQKSQWPQGATYFGELGDTSQSIDRVPIWLWSSKWVGEPYFSEHSKTGRGT